MSNTKKSALQSTFALAATAALLGTGLSPALATVNPDGSKTITVAAITDFHGHIYRAPNLACQLDALRTENPDTLFVANGDSIGGSAYVSAVADDVPTLEILNTMGLDVSSAGNHEFDRGYADLTGRVAGIANFKHLTANLDGANDPSTPPYEIFEVAEGLTVAFVGGSPIELPQLVSPAGLAGITVNDPVSSMDLIGAQLKDGDPANGEADIVVGLLHSDNSIAAQLGASFDAVVAGHSHTSTASVTTGTGAPVIQPGNYGTELGILEFSITADGTITAAPSLSPVEDYTKNPDACVNPQVQALYEAAAQNAEELGKQVVGTVVNNGFRGVNADGSENRGTESSASTYLADAFYKFAELNNFAADFAIMNPGGVRATIDQDGDGTITAQESNTVQPFGNTMSSADLTGAQIKQLLEQQWEGREGQSRPVLALGLSSSLKYLYDHEAPVGSKIQEVRLNGEAIDLTDTSTTYRVITNGFLLDGADGFTVLADSSNRTDLGFVDMEAVNQVLAANPGYEILAQKNGVSIVGPGEVTPGKSYEFSVAGFSLTHASEALNSAGVAEIQVLNAAGNVLGTAILDTTITDNNPETGRGTVRVAIPADAPAGELRLNFVSANASWEYPVQVVAPAVVPPVGESPVVSPVDQTPVVPPVDESPARAGFSKPSAVREALPRTGADASALAASALIMLVLGSVVTALPRRK